MKFKRILLKLSGESLMGNKQHGIDDQRLSEYADQIAEITRMGIQVGIVIGGGNIFRGLSGAGRGFDRIKGDQMGMLATVINSLALSSALETKALKHAFSQPYAWSLLANSTLATKLSKPSSVAKLPSSLPAQATHISQPTQVHLFAVSKSKPT